MIYLILAVLCSASMAVALRLSEGYSSNKYAILTGNYVTCTFIAYILLPEKRILPSLTNLFRAGAEAGAETAMMTAVLAGIINGVFFLGMLLLLQYSIKKNGAVLSSAFAKLGIMLPVAASVLFLNERPTLLQTAGMLLVAAAILVINLEKGKGGASSKMLLLVLFLFSGMGDGMAKVFERIDDEGTVQCKQKNECGRFYQRNFCGDSQLFFHFPASGGRHQTPCLPCLSLFQRGNHPDCQLCERTAFKG